MFNTLKVSQKLLLGFGLLLFFIIFSNGSNYLGLNSIEKDIYIIGKEEAPISDAANEMKISLLVGRNAMEEYKAATTVVLNDHNEAETTDPLAAFEQSLVDFDQLANAIVKGGTVGDSLHIVATDNDQLAAEIIESDKIHNEQFQPAARAMIKASNQLLALDKQKRQHYVSLANSYDQVMAEADIAETAIQQNTAIQGNTLQFSALVDATMEIKVFIQDSYIVLNNIISLKHAAELLPLLDDYQQTIKGFDQIINALLLGGEIDGTIIEKLTNQNLVNSVKHLDEVHAKMQLFNE